LTDIDHNADLLENHDNFSIDEQADGTDNMFQKCRICPCAKTRVWGTSLGLRKFLSLRTFRKINFSPVKENPREKRWIFGIAHP